MSNQSTQVLTTDSSIRIKVVDQYPFMSEVLDEENPEFYDRETLPLIPVAQVLNEELIESGEV